VLQNIIDRSSTKAVISYVDKNLLPNCIVTRQDILRGEDMFGPNLGSLKENDVYCPDP